MSSNLNLSTLRNASLPEEVGGLIFFLKDIASYLPYTTLIALGMVLGAIGKFFLIFK